MVRAVLIAAVLSVAFVGAAAATRVGEVSETQTLGPGSAESGNQVRPGADVKHGDKYGCQG